MADYRQNRRMRYPMYSGMERPGCDAMRYPDPMMMDQKPEEKCETEKTPVVICPDEMEAGKPVCDNIDEYPVGIAYVPWQKWDKTYELDAALKKGTIFPELDKPFYGRRAFER